MSPVLALVGFVGLCLLVAAADGSIVAGAARGWYLSLNRPPGTPPNWVFAAVWTALYAMIGLAGWLVWRRTVGTRALRLWGWQLAANAFWTPAFFALHSPPLAFAICLAASPGRCLADGAISGLDRLRDVSDRRLLVAQSKLS